VPHNSRRSKKQAAAAIAAAVEKLECARLGFKDERQIIHSTLVHALQTHQPALVGIVLM